MEKILGKLLSIWIWIDSESDVWLGSIYIPALNDEQ